MTMIFLNHQLTWLLSFILQERCPESPFFPGLEALARPLCHLRGSSSTPSSTPSATPGTVEPPETVPLY